MKFHDGGVESGSAPDSKARKLFWGSSLLTVLILTHLFYLAGKSGGVLALIETFLPAVLIWSMVMTAYSFYVVHGLAERRGQQIGASFTDPGTGVFTLDHLKSCLEHERHRVEEAQSRPGVIAYVDMMRLENVNRGFGHAVGDIVLRAVAQSIVGHVRPGDVVGRVGGDEFLVLMPDTSIGDAQGVTTAIQETVRDYRLDMGKRGRVDFLDCNVGLATFPEGEQTPEDAIAAARQKLPSLLSTVRQSHPPGAAPQN